MKRRNLLTSLVFVAFAFASAGCASHPAGSSSSPNVDASADANAGASATAAATAAPAPLPVVTAPPVEQKRPPWITELSPTKEAAVGAQIRIRFANDVVPVEMLEAPDREAALAKVEIAPKIPGHFVFVTPRMIVFSAEAAVPTASRIVVTLRAGLADLKGNSLDHDLAYTFTTKAPVITISTSANAPPQGARPRIDVQSNVPLDEKSLAAHATLQAKDGTSIPLAIASAPPASASASANATATPESSTSFDSDDSTSYTLVADRDVPLASSYVATIAAGVTPRYGNLATTDKQTQDVRTYGPLAFENIVFDTSGSNRPLVSGDPTLAFANELDPTTIDAAVSLTPAAKPGYALLQSDGSTGIQINPRALEPLTTYAVHIAHTLKDRFGQTLDKDANATFTTGALAPDLWAPAGFAIFPSTMSVALNVATANLPNNRYRSNFRKLAPEDVISTDVGDPDDLDAVLGKDPLWKPTAALAAPNRETTTGVALAQTFGAPTGLLAYGIADEYTLPGASETDQHFVGAVQVTNVGVFAQWFPTGGFVRAHHLSDGSPIAGASVEVYESKPAPGAERTPCASGTTDATGTALFAQSVFQRCLYVASSDDSAPPLVAIVHDHSDWAFARTGPYYESLGDSYAAWSAGKPHARGGFVSDRQLYQRGETAYFTGFGYFETADAIGIGSSKTYDVVAKSPQGKTTSLGAHTLDAFGSFDVRTALPADADLGDWTITATGTRGESFDGSFTVAEFKPPTFKVALAVDAHTAVGGDTVHATTTSAYLFGAPLANGQERVTVTRSQSSFTPKDFDGFSYGPQYEYPEEPPTLDSDVSESDVPTAADGKNVLAIPVAADLPFPVDYRVDAEVKDVSNLAVGDNATFTALPSRSLIVLRGEYLDEANKNYGFDFAVVDPNGKLTSGTTVHFTLARRVFDSATQLVEGSETPHDSVHYETVHEFDATSSDAVQHLQTMPDKGGEYRLRANLPGAKSEATATDVMLYVVGEDAQWYRSDDTSLSVKLDKTSYKPGDTAHALIASPYPDAELLFTVIRNGMLQRKIVNVHGAAANIPFTITPAMLPNVVVEAVLIRRGAALSKNAATKVSDLSREGFATVHVALDSKYVTVTAKPQSASVAPGGTQHIALHVSDASGHPLRGEITLAVANDAILQLSGYRFPDLVKQIYADVPISTRYADNRSDVKLTTASKPMEKGFGYGGGAMPGPAGTRVRTKFRPIAFFDGSVRTDAKGNATVSFTLPDDLTTWRVLALARTADARFGTSDATFVATKPLVTTPILPQFARPGDTLEGGVSVTNVSATKPGTDPGDISVTGTLTGPLSFSGNISGQKTHFDGPTAGYRFAMRANGTAPEASMKFLSTLGGASDAFEVPLPIVTDDVLESVVQTGTTQGTENVPLDFDASLPNDAGGLHVTLASTLLGNTLAPLDAALANDGPPFAFENASRIAIAADRILLERRYGTTADVPQLLKRIATQRNLLRANARPDGSYAFFPQGPSDAFTTAFVAIQLVQAQHAGVDVAADLASVHKNLLAVLADPSRADAGCKSDICKAETRLEALETLAPLGDIRSDHLSDIYQLRDKMSYYERVELARHLVRIAQWAALGRNLRDELLQQVNETGRFAGLVQQSDFGESQIDGESQVLGLMMDTNMAGDRIDRVFNTLLAARGRDGTWGCACDDAEAMNAIVQYAARDTVPPNFTAQASMIGTNGSGTSGGNVHFAHQFEGYKNTQMTRDIAMSALPIGKTTMVLTRGPGAGTLHYTVDFDYAIRGATAGAYQGIRIDRIVRPAGGTAAPLATFGLATPTQPLTLDAGQVFDIEDRITTDHPLEGLVVADSLAAGLEAIDTRFATNSTRVFESVADWNIDYQTIERSRVVTYASTVQPGVYAFHYLVRSVTPGTYSWPSAKASLALAPDEFGRTASTTLIIK